MIGKIRRMRFENWFIQSTHTEHGYLAWASKEPSNNVMKAKDPVYFQTGKTEIEAIDKLKSELRSVGDA
jgi:hypothetical protein